MVKHILCVSSVSFQLFCPETPVEAVAGHPVILKCYTKPELKVEKVEWLVNGSDEVHLFRKGKDSYVSQNEKYKGKTSLFKDELYRGNSSLNLTADMSHSGNYCCLVSARKVHRDCYITVNGKYTVACNIFHNNLNDCYYFYYKQFKGVIRYSLLNTVSIQIITHKYYLTSISPTIGISALSLFKKYYW